MRSISLVAAASLLLAAGCTAEISAPGGGNATVAPGHGPGSSNGPVPVDENGKPLADAPGAFPLRRLTGEQLRNTLRDLLGIAPMLDLEAPSDLLDSSGFLTGATMSTLDADHYLQVVEQAGSVIAPNLAALAPCAEPAGNDACATSFITSFGRRAFRRAPDATDVQELLSHYRQVRAELAYDHVGAVRLVAEAMLMSPRFLYLYEPLAPAAVAGSTAPLSQDSIASRLSYFLWNSMPDEGLFKAADAGSLVAERDLAAQAGRLLMDERGRAAISSFHLQWLELTNLPNATKSAEAYPFFTSQLLSDMQEETISFANDVIRGGGDGRFATLLTAPYSFLNGSLAAVYGVVGKQGQTFSRTELDSSQRAGILTQPAFLAEFATASGSHPVRRGKVIWGRVLCGEMPPPPDVLPAPDAPAPNLSTRERFAEHSAQACAVGCHRNIDPLGFALEHFDGIGQYRAIDGGKPVDASALLVFPSGAEAQVDGAVELVRAIADSPDAQQCVARQWLRFALGRAEVDGDAASLATISNQAKADDFNLRTLLTSIATSRAFTHQTLAP